MTLEQRFSPVSPSPDHTLSAPHPSIFSHFLLPALSHLLASAKVALITVVVQHKMAQDRAGGRLGVCWSGSAVESQLNLMAEDGEGEVTQRSA